MSILTATTLALGLLATQAHPVDSVRDEVLVTLLEIDVQVLDENGQHELGLKAEDFIVEEDGVRLEIVDAIELGPPGGELSPASPGTTGPTASDLEREDGISVPENQHSGLFVSLYFDLLHLGFGDRERLLIEVDRYLDSALPEAFHSVAVFDGDLEVVQGFTRDRAKVREAVAEIGSRSLDPIGSGRSRFLRDLREMQELAVVLPSPCSQFPGFVATWARERRSTAETSIRSLGHYANGLGGLVGRHHVIVFGEGWPISPGEELFLVLEQWCRDEMLPMTATVEPLTPIVEELARLASERHVTLSFVDARGVAAPLSSDVGLGPMSQADGDLPASTVLHSLRNNPRDAIHHVANETGGTLVLDTNTIGSEIGELVQLGAQRYRLLVRPQREADTRTHRLSVSVPRHPKSVVRHRRAHRDRTVGETLADRTLGSLWYDLEFNPLGVEVRHGPPTPYENLTVQLPLRVRVPLRSLVLVPDGRGLRAEVDLFVAIEDGRGRRSVPIRQREIIVVEEADRRGGGIWTREINLVFASGKSQIAVTVFDRLAGRGSFVLHDYSPEDE